MCPVFCPTDSWEKNWVYSKHPGKEFGKFVRTAGKFFNDEAEDQGMSNISLSNLCKLFLNLYRYTDFTGCKVLCTEQEVQALCYRRQRLGYPVHSET